MYKTEFLDRWFKYWLDTESFYAFGLFIVGFLVYLFKIHFEDLKLVPKKTEGVGTIFCLAALFLYIIGTRADIYYFISLSLIIFIIGLVLCFYGLQLLKKIFVPLILFALTLPIFPLYKITMPLQSLSTHLSSDLFNLLGIPAFDEGNVINIMGRRISVVAGCSGVKSLFNLFFISIVYSYFVNVDLKKKVFLVLSTLPFAIVLNVVRITLVGLYVLYQGYEGSHEFHDIAGNVLLALSVGAIMLVFKNLQDEDKMQDWSKENEV
jgi:exosortase